MRQASGRSLRAVLGAGVAGLLLACGSKVEGTYSNVNGLAVLELRSGGKGALTFAGETHECSYTLDDRQVRMSCGRERFTFRRNDDGTLTGEGFLGIMKKSKS